MKCSFCNKTMHKGTGKMFVRNTGEILYWCSGKCENSFKMGRLSKKFKWTKESK